MSVDSVNGKTGVVELTAADIPGAVSELALADENGAAMVGFLQEGVGAAKRTSLEKQRREVAPVVWTVF